MQGAEQDRKFVTLAEALSWIAFRTPLHVAGIKERLRNDPAVWASLEDAMQQFSVAAGDGQARRVRPLASNALGRYLTRLHVPLDHTSTGGRRSMPSADAFAAHVRKDAGIHA